MRRAVPIRCATGTRRPAANILPEREKQSWRKAPGAGAGPRAGRDRAGDRTEPRRAPGGAAGFLRATRILTRRQWGALWPPRAGGMPGAPTAPAHPQQCARGSSHPAPGWQPGCRRLLPGRAWEPSPDRGYSQEMRVAATAHGAGGSVGTPPPRSDCAGTAPGHKGSAPATGGTC